MHRITIIVLLALLLPDLYIYFVHVVRATRKRLWRLAYWLPTLLLLAIYTYYIYRSGENTLAHHTVGIGRFAIAVIVLTVSKTIFLLCSLVGLLVHLLVRRCPRRPFNLIGMVLGAFLLGCTLYGTLIGVSRFQVNEVEYRSPDLPEGFDGYRVLQLSDIHIGSWQGSEKAMERMVRLANEQQADVILFTGDLVNQRSDELLGFTDILARLHAPDGVFSVLGNHDYGDYYHWPNEQAKVENLENLKQRQAEMGWKLLNNSHTMLHHGGDSIALVGVENDGEPPFSQHADLPQATRGTEGVFTILMSHNPTHWRREVLPTTDIQLMLAGHTHAMQSVFFGRSLAELKYPEWRGFYHEGGQTLYVNIGIGYVGLPFRFGANPEITVITLRKS